MPIELLIRPDGGIVREQAENFSVRLREAEERADKKSGFGFPAGIRHRAKENVSLDFRRGRKRWSLSAP